MIEQLGRRLGRGETAVGRERREAAVAHVLDDAAAAPADHRVELAIPALEQLGDLERWHVRRGPGVAGEIGSEQHELGLSKCHGRSVGEIRPAIHGTRMSTADAVIRREPHRRYARISIVLWASA